MHMLARIRTLMRTRGLCHVLTAVLLFQADQICYAILCVFSYVAAQQHGRLQQQQQHQQQLQQQQMHPQHYLQQQQQPPK